MLEPTVSAISSIISLAELALRTCAAASTYKKDCVRIGARLQVLIVLSKQWGGTATAPSISSLKNLQNVLSTLALTLQRATTEQSTWTKRVRTFAFSTSILDDLLNAERNLNSALADFQTAQNYQLLQVVSQNFNLNQRVEAVLLQLAQRRISPDNADSPSVLQVMNQVLDEHQKDPKSSDIGGTEMTDAASSATTDHASDDDNDTSYLDSVAIDDVGIEVESVSVDHSSLKYSTKSNDCLGSGSFGDVYRGTYKGEKVAVKLIRIPPFIDANHRTSIIARMKREATVMARMSIHPNILHLQGFDLEDSQPLLVLELMDSTLYAALRSKTNRLDDSKLLDLMKGISSALEFLHLQGIVHRDIKSLNILLSKDVLIAKLSDFGEAKDKGLRSTSVHGSTLVGSAAKAHGGTMAYHSPEILVGKLAGASRKADMYAFGVVLWECLTRKTPFEGKRDFDVIRFALEVTEGKRSFLLAMPEIGSLQTQEAKALLTVTELCLQRSPKDRPNATQAIRRLQTSKDTHNAVLDDPPGAPVETMGTNNNFFVHPSTALSNYPITAPNDEEEVIAKPNNDEEESLTCHGLSKKQRIAIGSIIALLLLVTITAVAVCASGNCSSGGEASSLGATSRTNQPLSPSFPTDEEAPDNPTRLSSSPVATPPISTDSPMPQPVVSPTKAPVVAPTSRPLPQPTQRPVVPPAPVVSSSLSTPRSESIVSYINSITLSGLTLSYPNGGSLAEEKALNWMIEEDVGTAETNQLNVRQRFALATLWFQIGLSDYAGTWLSSMDECDWTFIGICVGGEVMQIVFQEDAIGGQLPSDLGLLTALTYLSLYKNQLTGSIPSEMGMLTALTYLNLWDNQLSGSIPSEIGMWTALRVLQLGQNQLTGIIPSEIRMLTNLVWLDLKANQLTGSIPSDLGLFTALEWLLLRSNQLTGTIPTELEQLTVLDQFFVYNNNLSGEMPFCDGATRPGRFEFLVADCNEVICSCCTECCPNGGFEGILSGDNPCDA